MMFFEEEIQSKKRNMAMMFDSGENFTQIINQGRGTMLSNEEIKSKKRKITMKMKKHRVDRLSALPDCLLIHILSFVREPVGLTNMWSGREEASDVKKTAVTSVLSERWRYVWAELPVLRFQEKSREMEKISKFVNMVNRTLAIRTANSANYLEKFYLEFRFSQIWAVYVDKWLAFASKSKAKVVSLVLPRENSVGYALPEMFYRNSSLTELELAQCRIAPGGRIEWRCLSRLEFCGVELREHVIENILSGCPVLNNLGLEYCWGFNRLNINTPSVGKLAVWDQSPANRPLLEISAPHVHYLDISSSAIGNEENRKIRVKNIPCVVKALIDIKSPEGFLGPTPEDISDAEEWIEATRHIPELHLTDHLFMLLSDMVVGGWQIPQSKRVSLALDISSYASDEDTILAIVRLLEFSPHLEKLEVFTPFLREYDLLERLRDDDFSFCCHFRLKTVNIECYAGPDGEDNPIYADIVLLLARILLERAMVLEKMSILVNSGGDCSEFMKILEQVNTYPRLSKQAQVLILTR